MTADAPRRALRAGLTGGIASGKTTVAGFFSEAGAYLIDADRIAHETMQPGGSTFDGVVARFGPDILDRHGHIRREALAAIVFSDAEARCALNAIVHPAVIVEVERRIEVHAGIGRSPVVMVDAALIVESGFNRRLDRLVVVRCSRDAQVRRLIARGLGADAALARIDSQASLEEKLAVAHYVIDTDTTLRETRREVERVWVALLGDFERLCPPAREGDGAL